MARVVRVVMKQAAALPMTAHTAMKIQPGV
jgi:hypothetical protein